MIKNYISVIKPGIISGNLITASAGFFLASKGHVNFWLFFVTLVGLSLIVAPACVFNNYLDRDIDKKMKRTQGRALVRGIILGKNALIYAFILLISGTLLLVLFTNLLTVFFALTGFFFYVIVYTFAKRKTSYGTIIGSVSGAVPPVVGYFAVRNRLDMSAVILFLILVLWQMPHFYAIAIYRMHDYASAAIPVLPVKKGIFITKIHILLYIIAFGITACLLTIFRYTGYVYLVVAVLLSCLWLGFAAYGFITQNNTVWARKMFILSLVIITLLCIMITVSSTLLTDKPS